MEFIYRLFGAFTGGDILDYLSGFNCEEEAYVGSNQFLLYGFIALGIASLVMVIYYYIINHPSFNRWWHWLIMLGVVGVSNLLIGALRLISHLDTGMIGECLEYGSNGGVDIATCWMFGLSNFFISIIFFIILSITFKWWSTSCVYSGLT